MSHSLTNDEYSKRLNSEGRIFYEVIVVENSETEVQNLLD